MGKLWVSFGLKKKSLGPVNSSLLTNFLPGVGAKDGNASKKGCDDVEAKTNFCTRQRQQMSVLDQCQHIKGVLKRTIGIVLNNRTIKCN